ncbi:hypothetical protein DBZ36_07470 [Alginatibacterium sediminis]|uniref:Uncharacterized protein n=1 Tax=Alginatibacterium sediminis TaxID=2164068 RepID=A0A420EHS6_9ALTE|nr:hypothetical protein [Alginatibacterium sediminis]RKF20272.1 hypothetical protein DBZ36_07470 [Alginatibacterium sediminis]
MDDIYCAYFDEEIDQDVPSQPTLDEALNLLHSFNWSKANSESAMKALMFQFGSTDNVLLSISKPQTELWICSMTVVKRRAFCGPFFRRKHYSVLIDITSAEVEEIVRLIYTTNLQTITEFVNQAELEMAI